MLPWLYLIQGEEDSNPSAGLMLMPLPKSHQVAMSSASSSGLTNAYADIFHFYRAVMPIAHAVLLASVPSIGMQFANDCLYIAKACSLYSRRKVPRGFWNTHQIVATRKALDALQQFGVNTVDVQIVSCLQLNNIAH